MNKHSRKLKIWSIEMPNSLYTKRLFLRVIADRFVHSIQG